MRGGARQGLGRPPARCYAPRGVDPVASPPDFQAPPLIEAVFDLFAVPAHDTDPKRADAFFRAFPEYGGDAEELHQWGMDVQMRDGRPVSQTLSTQTRGERRWDPARSRSALFGPGVLALNILNKPDQPYGHFRDHAPELQRCLEQYLEIARPERLLWAGHRYINHVSLAPDENPAELFALYPALPSEHARTHPGISVQVETARFHGGVVVASLVLAFKNPTGAVYALDLYAKTEGELAVSSVRDLMDWHRRAHDHVVQTFLFAITRKARLRFKEKA